MAERRRTLMPPPDANTSSRLPVPGSAMKQSHGYGARPSVAPNAGGFNPRMSTAAPLRTSAMGPPPAPSTVGRPSVAYRSGNTNPLLQSARKPDHLRTPMGSSSVRRESVYGRGAPAAAAAQPAITKDPRPLRDKPLQNAMWDDIVRWLKQTGFEGSDLRLSSINGHSFRAIFEHLVSTASSTYYFPPPEDTREKAKWEAEFIAAVNWLRYPFPVDVKWLAAPLTPHSWPSLLGLLHWLADMGKLRIQYLESQDPSLLDPSCIPEDFDDSQEDYHAALALEYFSTTYEHFLHTGHNTFPEQDRELADRYAKKNETILKQLAEYQKELEQLDAERESLISSKPKVEEWRQKTEQAEQDLRKCQDLVEKYTRRKAKEEDLLAKEKRELELRENDKNALRIKLESLERTVKEQNLSAEEVIQMNTSHETLSQAVKELEKKLADTRAQLMSLEVTVTNRATAAEEAVDFYNGMIVSLQLLPTREDELDLGLELNTAADSPEQLLAGPDLRRVVRPALNRIAEERRRDREDVESERIAVEHEVDGLAADCDVLQAEIAAVSKEVTRLTEEAEGIREAAAEEAAVNDQRAEELERELVQAKQAAKAHGVGAKARLQQLQIAEQEQLEKVARLREETSRAIVKNCDDMLKFRNQMSTMFDSIVQTAQARAQ